MPRLQWEICHKSLRRDDNERSLQRRDTSLQREKKVSICTRKLLPGGNSIIMWNGLLRCAGNRCAAIVISLCGKWHQPGSLLEDRFHLSSSSCIFTQKAVGSSEDMRNENLC